jgi:hypothetical protein
MYCLNLLFDNTNQNGLFVESPNPAVLNPLQNSKHWLKIPTAQPPAGFNPHAQANWTRVGRAGTLSIPHIPPAPPGGGEHFVGVRIAPDLNIGDVPNDATAELLVAFGRPVIANQDFASPFKDANGQTLTAFYFPPVARNGAAGWFFQLAQIDISRRPAPGSDLSSRFEFAIGLNIRWGGTNDIKRSYGEDPEFDIEG